jgi:hypothetical protein
MIFTRILKFTATLGLTLLGLHTAEASIKNCGNEGSQLQITELKLVPDPPIRGKPFELVLKTNNNGANINQGTITTSLSLNFIPFAPSITPLCDDINCPIASGFNDFSKTATWPDTVTGAISSKVVWKDSSNTDLLCVQINTKVINTNKLRHESNFTQFDADLFMKTLTYQKEPEAFNADCLVTSFQKV